MLFTLRLKSLVSESLNETVLFSFSARLVFAGTVEFVLLPGVVVSWRNHHGHHPLDDGAGEAEGEGGDNFSSESVRSPGYL